MQDSKYKLDRNQKIISYKLSQIAQDLEKISIAKILRKILFMKPKKIQGLYIFGDVGRGKSMLMKEFYYSLSKTPKLYCHFNSFMKTIHEAFRDVRKNNKKQVDQLTTAIDLVINTKSEYFLRFMEEAENQKSKNIFSKKQIKVLCLDEFQVIDAADSMILSRILTYLFSKGLIVIFTSNLHPNELYKNGIQAELFNDFVQSILIPNSPPVKLDSVNDYRETKVSKSDSRRFFVSEKYFDDDLNQIISFLTHQKSCFTTKIKVWGREINVQKSYLLEKKDKSFLFNSKKIAKDKINSHISHNFSGQNHCSRKFAIFSFDEICCNSYSAADYQAICQNFDLILLLKIPPLTPEDTNEARRLTLFIDEIYENKNALIALSARNIEKIYPDGIGSKAFLRTISRLKEIQSDEYWNNSKISCDLTI